MFLLQPRRHQECRKNMSVEDDKRVEIMRGISSVSTRLFTKCIIISVENEAVQQLLEQ